MIADIITELGPWAWHVAGLLLLGLEILAPGSFFLWFGIGALLVGTLALFTDYGWQVNVLLFLAISFACLFAGRRMLTRRHAGDETDGDPALNRRGQRYVGREFVLGEPIRAGTGRLNVDDTVWRVHGPDLPAGSRVTVARVDGAVLVVVASET